MARIRTIKPEFFTSEQIAECSPSARLLFVGMWCFCDDRGVHPASIKRLKMEVFPADEFTLADIKDMVDELKSAGLLKEFAYKSESFWHVTGWRHQKIERPTYKFPPPPDINEDSPTDRRHIAEDSPTDRPRKGREGKGRDIDTDTTITTTLQGSAHSGEESRNGGGGGGEDGKSEKDAIRDRLSRLGVTAASKAAWEALEKRPFETIWATLDFYENTYVLPDGTCAFLQGPGYLVWRLTADDCPENNPAKAWKDPDNHAFTTIRKRTAEESRRHIERQAEAQKTEQAAESQLEKQFGARVDAMDWIEAMELITGDIPRKIAGESRRAGEAPGKSATVRMALLTALGKSMGPSG